MYRGFAQPLLQCWHKSSYGKAGPDVGRVSCHQRKNIALMRMSVWVGQERPSLTESERPFSRWRKLG